MDKSELLSRVAAFLPQLKAANEELDRETSRTITAFGTDLIPRKEEEEEDAMSSSSEESESDWDEKTNTDPVPGVEFDLALVENMENHSNPFIRWLSREEEEEDCEKQPTDNDEEEHKNDSEVKRDFLLCNKKPRLSLDDRQQRSLITEIN